MEKEEFEVRRSSASVRRPSVTGNRCITSAIVSLKGNNVPNDQSIRLKLRWSVTTQNVEKLNGAFAQQLTLLIFDQSSRKFSRPMPLDRKAKTRFLDQT